MYKLFLDNDSEILVHEDYILKNELLLTKEISDDDIINIDKINNNYNAYSLAIKYIGIKHRSCYEVYDYLNNKEVERVIIEEVIEKLKNQKYLDDYNYAKSFIHDRINFSNYGPYKIKKELEDKKISSSIIEEELKKFDYSLEREKLDKLVFKYVKGIKNKSFTMMKNKVCDYFSSLGYSNSIVLEVLSGINYDDNDAREREYNRLYNKLSKKYSGKELEMKIKQGLYNRGYR